MRKLLFLCLVVILSQTTGEAGIRHFTLAQVSAAQVTPAQMAPFLWVTAKRGLTLSGSDVTGWADQSGNSYNLAPLNTNPTYSATGMNGVFPTVSFDGTQNNVGRIGIGGSNRTTFSWWAVANPTAFATFNGIWYAPSTAGSWLLASKDIYLEDGAFSQSIDYWVNALGARAGTGTNSFPNATATEIGGDYNGTTLTTYINSVSTGTGSASPAQIGDRISIGGLKPGYSSLNWNGKISEIAFFDHVLTSTERTQLHAYAQYQWFPIWAGETRSFYYDGHSRSDCGTSAFNWEYTQPLTFSFWMKADSGQTDKISIVGREQASGAFRGFDLLRELNGKISLYQCGAYPTSCVYAFSTDVVAANSVTWTHGAVTTDGTGTAAGIKFYVNGHLSATSSTVNNLTTTIVDNSLHGNIGESYGPTPWKGNLDEIAIFTAELNQSDITTIYHSGLPTDLTGFHDLAHYFRMGEGNDSVNTINDQVGGLTCTTVGTGLITTATPLPLN